MRKWLVLGLVAANVAVASEATWLDSRNELGITNYVEEVATPDSVVARFQHQDARQTNAGEEAVIIEQVINLGQKVWKIIEKNKPVVNVKYSYANALPKGVRSAEELESFSPVQFRSYRMHGKNGFGATVYDLTYTLVHRYGGAYQGRGKYLDSVSVVPHKLNVLWGYTVNFGVDNVSTVNAGDRNAPVASALLEMNFKVSTVIKSSEFHGVYEFRGDSASVRAIEH